jgi:hypothetical protein
LSLNRVYSKEKLHDPCSGSLNIDIDHAGLHAGFIYDLLYLPGDIIEAVVGGGGYVDSFLHSSIFYGRLDS